MQAIRNKKTGKFCCMVSGRLVDLEENEHDHIAGYSDDYREELIGLPEGYELVKVKIVVFESK
jgi:hypothetical protein